MKITTELLKDMTVRVIKAASFNRMIPITGLIGISFTGNRLSLITTNGSHYFKVYSPEIKSKEAFSVTVQADLFSKLISKMTSKEVEFKVNGNVLEIKGNGSYKLDIVAENDNNLIFPDPSLNYKGNEVKFTSDRLGEVLTLNKASLANTMEEPYLTGYYCGEDVITTDSYKVGCTHTKLFDEDLLLTSELMSLIPLLKEPVKVTTGEDKIMFEGQNGILYGSLLEGKNDYPIDAINNYLDSEFENSVKVNKNVLLDVIDRLSIFVSDYDKNGIYLTFTKDGLEVTSKKSTGVELIPYTESNEVADYSCCADIEMMKEQITACPTDVIEIGYGHEQAMKIKTDFSTQIMALLEDDRVTENE